MHDIFHRFAEQLAVSGDTLDLHRALADICTSLELPSFAYLFPSTSLDQTSTLFSTYPETWTSHYLRSGYETLDPVIHQASLQKETFRWGVEASHTELSASQHQLMAEARQFGIRRGFTIPIHDRRGLFAALTFATDEREPHFFRVIERYELALRVVAILFHVHARQRLISIGMVDGVALSPREMECLQWAARGKSAWDIGRILGIAPRTAAFHLDNAKKKLGVRTITQAAIKFALSKPSDFTR